jgi:serine/threonine protein kinase/tetratricopeptide (TPR) repeat protein
MDQDRWNRVNRIFHAALDAEPGQRSALVASLADSDPELRSEVERLLKADDDAGSYLDAPLLSAEALSAELAAGASPLQPDDLLCGRFRIVREIAEGGMGHVFEAFDAELAVPVALKTIRPEIAANPEALARFRQEVRLARTVTHPNICRTFDIEREVRDVRGQRSEIVFLTMEYLPGETLSARIKRAGPLPLGEARALAGQIAAALTAAHALGVIHRDMKPANIMLVPSGGAQSGIQFGVQSGADDDTPRVVVTDFGLARLDPLLLDASPLHGSGSSFTNAANPVGTLAYMAPEQLEGAAVSPATDIYAFGLILFEMVTGRRAFPSGNLLSGIAQRLKGSPALDQMLPADVPAGWRDAIRSCLSAAPEERPQNPAQVLALLDGKLDNTQASKRQPHLPPQNTPKALAAPRRWARPAAFVVAALAAVALFAVGFRFYQVKALSQIPPGALVYLTPVQNRSGEAAFNGLSELIQAGLAQSIQVNLLDPGRVGDILQQMTKPPDAPIDQETGREIAMRAGAVRVVFATVSGGNGAYTLNIDIQQPDNTPARYREHWTRSFAWKQTPSANAATVPAPLLAEVRSASDWIRQQVGESANDIARLDAPPEDVTTDSWQALDDYTLALRLHHNGRDADAVVALRNATRLDPQFALAYGQLADIQFTLHHENECFEAYKKALDPALERRLSRRERDRIAGMYALDSLDFSAAADTFRDYQTFYPNDRLGWLYSITPLDMLGRTNEALANLKRAHALEPANASVLHSLAIEYMVHGDLALARTTLAQADSLAASPYITSIRGTLDFLEGKYTEASQAFTSLKTSSDPLLRSRAFAMLADLAAERGDLPGAVTHLDQGIQEDSAQGNPPARASKLAQRAGLKARLGDLAGCNADLRAALEGTPSPELRLMVETVLGQAIQLAPPATSHALRGRMVELDRNLAPGDFGMISRLLAMRSHAEAALASGDTAAALRQFRQLSALDAPAMPREYLGRALLASAAADRDPSHTAALRREAQNAYAKVALHPGSVWGNSYDYPPGFYADQLRNYLSLADALNDRSAEVQEARKQWALLRNNAPLPAPAVN